MNLKKAVPAAIVVTLITGAGLAHGAISHSKQPHPVPSSGSSGSLDPETALKSGFSDDRGFDRKERLSGERSDDRQRRADNDISRDRDSRDHESPTASLHHDGDDHRSGLSRADFERDSHSEASREIMHAARIRVASLYSPSHHAGYHARMHRHSR